jgi:hypothetical protein
MEDLRAKVREKQELELDESLQEKYQAVSSSTTCTFSIFIHFYKK